MGTKPKIGGSRTRGIHRHDGRNFVHVKDAKAAVRCKRRLTRAVRLDDNAISIFAAPEIDITDGSELSQLHVNVEFTDGWIELPTTMVGWGG